MGYQLERVAAEKLMADWGATYDIWAPVRKKGEGTFSEVDVVRYDKVTSLDEIEWEKKSDYSFKEVLFPINETLFYFTEDTTSVPKEAEKGLLIFLRACDLHALKRLDQIYLNNKFGDFYYERRRKHAKFVLMGCTESCKSGFCVSMGTNQAEHYDAYVKVSGDRVLLDVPCEQLSAAVNNVVHADMANVSPDYVTENYEKVTLPKNLSNESRTLPIWKEYGDRCIACGRCNFVCPTCTCYSMQDIFYGDNPKVGERRRTWASCEVDGYDEIAGGIQFRKTKGDRMRFKVMHKIYDYEKRFGYPMCVGCGRCDDVCPEYISYSTLVNRLAEEEEA